MNTNWFALCPKACDPNVAKTSSSSSQYTAASLVGWATPRTSSTEVVIVKAPPMAGNVFGFPRKKKHPELAHRTNLFFEEDNTDNVVKANVAKRSEIKNNVGLGSEPKSASSSTATTTSLGGVGAEGQRRVEASMKNGGVMRSSCSLDQLDSDASKNGKTTSESEKKTELRSKTDHSSSKSLVPMRNSGSEYKMKFRPFSVYEYVDGRFVSDETLKKAKSVDKAVEHPWYEEVIELRKEADNYRARGWGTDLVPAHIKELYKKQRERHNKSDLDALSLAFQPDPRGLKNKASRGGPSAPSPASNRGRGMSRTSHSRLASQSRSASRPASARPPGTAKRAESEEPSRLRTEEKNKKTKAKETEKSKSKASAVTKVEQEECKPTQEPSLPIHKLGKIRGSRSHPTGFAVQYDFGANEGPVDSLAEDVTLPRGTDADSSLATSCDLREASLIKSPPEPTRVVEANMANNVASPEPMNWTVPLDKANTLDVTHTVNSVAEAIVETDDEKKEEEEEEQKDNKDKIAHEIEENNSKDEDTKDEVSAVGERKEGLNGEIEAMASDLVHHGKDLEEKRSEDKQDNVDKEVTKESEEKKESPMASVPGTTLRLLEDPSGSLSHSSSLGGGHQEEDGEQDGHDLQGGHDVGEEDKLDAPPPPAVIRPTYQVLEDPFNL